MPKLKFYTNYDINIDIYHPQQIDVYVDKFKTEPIPEGTIRIMVLVEPREVGLLNLVKGYPDNYTYVLTYDEELLKTNPKARYFIGMNAWVSPYKDYDKKFAVSTLVGGKDRKGFEGYKLRHELWRRQKEINIPRDFYLSNACKFEEADYANNLVLPIGFRNSKNVMFDCMFHIAIENTSLDNYFTEKILDCFLTKTIPIYYGDPNIGNIFNNASIFVCNSVDEIIKTANNISKAMYQLMEFPIEDNYKRALQYIDFDVTLKKALIDLLK
jgi:hypothetical protein